MPLPTDPHITSAPKIINCRSRHARLDVLQGYLILWGNGDERTTASGHASQTALHKTNSPED
jgi:hypothetical protein